MIDWPPDVPAPSVDEIRSEILTVVAPYRESWPAKDDRGPVDALLRGLCANMLRGTTYIRGDELALAAGYSSHMALYKPTFVDAFVLSPAGISIRAMVLYRLVRLKRGKPLPTIPSRTHD